MLLRKTGGQLLIAPERMNPLGQSKKDTQLWRYVVVKAKSNTIQRNIAYAPGMLRYTSWILKDEYEFPGRQGEKVKGKWSR